MNEILAKHYGTNGAGLEKTAADEFAAALEQAGYDVNELDEAQLNELAEVFTSSMESEDEVQGDPAVEQETVEAQGEGEVGDDLTKEAAAQLHLAEAMGRQMARSYHDEMQKIASKNGKTKQASAASTVSELVERRALEILDEAGYLK